eukprot:s573_g6.t1
MPGIEDLSVYCSILANLFSNPGTAVKVQQVGEETDRVDLFRNLAVLLLLLVAFKKHLGNLLDQRSLRQRFVMSQMAQPRVHHIALCTLLQRHTLHQPPVDVVDGAKTDAERAIPRQPILRRRFQPHRSETSARNWPAPVQAGWSLALAQFGERATALPEYHGPG